MISSISVENYRSLKKTKLSLGPLTVLIGANGSGKSNILDAICFVLGIKNLSSVSYLLFAT